LQTDTDGPAPQRAGQEAGRPIFRQKAASVETIRSRAIDQIGLQRFHGKERGSPMTSTWFKRFSSFSLAGGIAAAALALALAPGPAAAQGTPQQQQACTPDAMRLCGAFIPDATKVAACMTHQKRSDLSQACRDAFPPPRPSHHTTHHRSH
jgi:hypothetical protein